MSYSYSLKKVVELIGTQAAIRLVRAKGGRDLKLPMPHNLSDNNWLVALVGMDNAKKLCNHFVGVSLKLPIEVNALVQLRNASIVIDYQDGMSISSIANNYQIDRKLVQKIIDAFCYRDTKQFNLI